MEHLILEELRNFICSNGTCKVGSWQEIRKGFITDLSDKTQETIKNLPEQAVNTLEEVKIEENNLIYLIKKGNKKYLINSEGYEYPRYIVRIQ